MLKFFINILEIVLIAKVGYYLIKHILLKKGKKKSIIEKICIIIANIFHKILDGILRKQKKRRVKVVTIKNNVIPFRRRSV